jgi:hypothetical protein
MTKEQLTIKPEIKPIKPEIAKQSLKSSSILKSYTRNIPRLIKLFEETGELRTLTLQRNELIRKVRELYLTIFKGLTSKKKNIEIDFRPETSRKYSITPVGFAIKSSNYSINSASIGGLEYMDFIREIKFLAKRLPDLETYLKKELSDIKYKLVKDFFTKTEYLNDIKETCEMIIGKEISCIHSNNYTYKEPENRFSKGVIQDVIEKIILNTDYFSFITRNHTHTSNFAYLNLEDIAYIEQLYPELMKLIKIGKQQRIFEMKNITKYIRYLEKKFQNILGFEELIKNGTD